MEITKHCTNVKFKCIIFSCGIWALKKKATGGTFSDTKVEKIANCSEWLRHKITAELRETQKDTYPRAQRDVDEPTGAPQSCTAITQLEIAHSYHNILFIPENLT